MGIAVDCRMRGHMIHLHAASVGVDGDSGQAAVDLLTRQSRAVGRRHTSLRTRRRHARSLGGTRRSRRAARAVTRGLHTAARWPTARLQRRLRACSRQLAAVLLLGCPLCRCQPRLTHSRPAPTAVRFSACRMHLARSAASQKKKKCQQCNTADKAQLRVK